MGSPVVMEVMKVIVFGALGLLVFLDAPSFCNGGSTSSFVRKDEKAVDLPLDSDVFRVPPGYNAPQQVHITQGDHVGKGVIISWVTMDEPGSNMVLYWRSKSKHKFQKKGTVTSYKFYNYTSGYIHHCTIKHLEYDTLYFYVVGIGHTPRQFWFRTPPRVGPDVPYTFGLIGLRLHLADSNFGSREFCEAWMGFDFLPTGRW